MSQDINLIQEKDFFKYALNENGEAVILGYTGYEANVSIPEAIDGHPITKIGDGAFRAIRHIVSVDMADSIKIMGEEAFRECSSLKSIHLSNEIGKLDPTAFLECTALEEINIPDRVIEIRRGTFLDSPLKRMHIGKGLLDISTRPFYNGKYDKRTHKHLTTRAIETVTVDPENAQLSAAGPAVFSKDGKVLVGYFGNEVTYTVPDGVEKIGAYAFEGLALLADVYLPDSLVEIGDRAFAETSIRSVVFGPNVKYIMEEAFNKCAMMTGAIFNDGLKVIGDRAFADTPIVSVQLPATLEKLGKVSFEVLAGAAFAAQQTQSFSIDVKNPYLKADGKALYSISDQGMTLLTIYEQEYKKYSYFTGYDKHEYTVAAGTTAIAENAGDNCISLNTLVLPDGLITIGDNAFAGCSNLTQINIPDSVETIGNNSFQWTKLREFHLGPNVKEIGTSAFITGTEWEETRTFLNMITLDEGNKNFYIKDDMLFRRNLDGTRDLIVYFGGDEYVEVPEGIKEICGGAFKRSIVQEVRIPSSVTTIGDEAFWGCNKLLRLRVGFAKPENGVDTAVIYIPEVTGKFGTSDTTIHDHFMDCIRVDGKGTVFDFVKYDSLYETIAASKDKILVATDRLKSAIKLIPLFQDRYLEYLRSNAKRAVEVVVEFDDLDGLNALAELEVFTSDNIDGIIEIANKAKKPEIVGYLMNYKNENIGIVEDDYDL